VRRIYQSFGRCSSKLIIVGSMINVRDVEPNNRFIDYIKKKNWYIDINNSSQIKRYLPAEATRQFPFLVGEGLQATKSNNGLACPPSSRLFADENQIFYHIDGVPTTHTGALKSKLT
jgi:hypothetical protein